MAVKNELIVVVYDIGDDRQRKKIGEILMDFGGLRVQKSVFECRLKKRRFEKLRGELQRLRGKGDSIRYYFLCSRCCEKIIADEEMQPPASPDRNYVAVV